MIKNNCNSIKQDESYINNKNIDGKKESNIEDENIEDENTEDENTEEISELDQKMIDFINFVNNKEKNEIPIPTPYVVSTRSGMCRMNNINMLDLSKLSDDCFFIIEKLYLSLKIMGAENVASGNSLLDARPTHAVQYPRVIAY